MKQHKRRIEVRDDRVSGCDGSRQQLAIRTINWKAKQSGSWRRFNPIRRRRRRKAHDDTYTIGADDVLAINVWKEPDLTRSVPVRSDGKNLVASDRRVASIRNHSEATGTGHREEADQLCLGAGSDCYRAGDQEQKV